VIFISKSDDCFTISCAIMITIKIVPENPFRDIRIKIDLRF